MKAVGRPESESRSAPDADDGNCRHAVTPEAARQQALLRVLWRDDAPSALQALLNGPVQAGVLAYRSNAGAAAQRALAAAYPKLQQLLGDEPFATLARALWQAQPSTQGDLGLFGAGLAGFIETDDQLAAEPYLADVARLEWAVHLADRALDCATGVAGLAQLASEDPSTLTLRFTPGCALISSAYPVATLWLAHDSQALDRFLPARTALAAGLAETAWVWRQGWHTHVTALAPSQVAFQTALCSGSSLGQALNAAAADFDFTAWLQQALQNSWLAQVELSAN